ncbi:MAG: prolyl oligopeptidase family serine peptidase [Verrucomicrobiales bacterium]|nr:prolyl oligopeptidase family serine peptidase [Verrucomicrobiales bacterium]MDP4792801.1 prolyl oligopeptidase family serine peptidase [Verrucomicrobiales bacterium]MDP5005872.1 prolyl oligopeptidase family serine peptidase [Verrucomicrobiales bacterium]
MSRYLSRFFPRLVLVAALFGSIVSAQEPAPATAKAKPTPAKPTPPPPAVDHLGIKLIPQPGIAIPDADRAELAAGVASLGKEIESLRGQLGDKPEQLALLPDVEIFHKAVDWALRYDEFFEAKQVGIAKTFLELGRTRSGELAAGTPSWLSATGLVIRGYRSKIDNSVQPYGMVIPGEWKPGEKVGRRLDFWAHGRGEKLSELDFIHQRLTKEGEFNPPSTFTLHLYGRYCNANKFAGEVDLFEALDHAREHYPIDQNRLVMRGFSMGGAAVWQFGTHYAGMWAAIQPGAGFAETREFNKVYAEGKTPPTPWEETLYRWYDATDHVANLANTTTIAYSGEIDGQKQAADIMIRYARREAGETDPPAAEINKVNPGDGSPKASEARVAGTTPDLAFYHVIGPQTPHKILPEAKPEIESLIEAALAKRESSPQKIRFVTYTLIYPELAWVRVEGLEKQWERSEVTARITADKIVASTTNVTTLRFSPDTTVKSVELDGEALAVSGDDSALAFHREGGKWIAGPATVQDGSLTKTPTVCGPVDHAFMSSFVFVRPTGSAYHEKTGTWAASELDHATGFWRKVFRGEAPVKDDSAITDTDIASSNLVLWGDPSSNVVLRKILPKLPLTWDAKKIVLAGREYTADATMPVLIFPNPLNPEKYVVLNSGPTFREDALLNNSQQIPKLPDWSFIDINTPVDGKWPGKVVTAGFFDENWQVKLP